MKLDRNLLLAGVGLLALGMAAQAQSVNPGAASSGPTTLGPGTAVIGKAGIDPANNTVAVPAIPAPVTNASGTVTAGGSFQSALAASTARKGCLIQNPVTATEPLYVYFGTGTPTTNNSIGLNAGGTADCKAGGAYVVPDAIQVSAATTGHPYILKSQ